MRECVYSCAHEWQSSYCPRGAWWSVVYWWSKGESDGGGNGTEKGSAAETRDRAPLSLFLSFPTRTRGTRSFFTFKNHDDAHFSDS